MISQDITQYDANDVFTIKQEIRYSNRKCSEDQANTIYHQIPLQLKGYVDVANKRGSLCYLWMTKISSYIRETLEMHYVCTMAIPYPIHLGSVTAGMHSHQTMPWSVTWGASPLFRHNQIRDKTASLLTEVCSNVATEPHLQLLSGEGMRPAFTITDHGAGLDIHTRDFWNNRQNAFFDVRVFHPDAPRTVQEDFPLCIIDMKTRKRELMVSASVTLSMVYSPH